MEDLGQAGVGAIDREMSGGEFGMERSDGNPSRSERLGHSVYKYLSGVLDRSCVSP